MKYVRNARPRDRLRCWFGPGQDRRWYDASFRHEAWMQLFAIQKKPVETYVDLYRRVEAARARIDRVTPSDLTATQRSEELGLFTIINALGADNSLRRRLISQKNVTLDDAYSTFLCTDRGEAIRPEAMESAHAALGGKCFLCYSLEHFARECPHRDAITHLVNRRNAGSDGKGRGGGGDHGNSTQANAASTSGTTGTSANATDANRSSLNSSKFNFWQGARTFVPWARRAWTTSR